MKKGGEMKERLGKKEWEPSGARESDVELERAPVLLFPLANVTPTPFIFGATFRACRPSAEGGSND